MNVLHSGIFNTLGTETTETSIRNRRYQKKKIAAYLHKLRYYSVVKIYELSQQTTTTKRGISEKYIVAKRKLDYKNMYSNDRVYHVP